MVNHIDLGKDQAERRKNLASLIRSGAVSLGGYKKARIYGLLSCSSGKRMKTENRVFFKNETEAIAHSYRPCGNCMPEKYKKWKAGRDFKD
jgi:methylphosphotriester-DNA--protein-cysteine methyltransferase